MTATVITVTARQVAMLRAVAAGRAELSCSRVPDLYVDGRPCTDHGASAALAAAGLVTGTGVGRVGERRPARLAPVAVALLAELELNRRAELAATSIENAPTRRCVAVGSRRRVGSPTTCEAEGPSMVTTSNLDCLDLGCDWDWWIETCGRGHRHTVRVCARCLTPDELEPCPPAAEPADKTSGVAA